MVMEEEPRSWCVWVCGGSSPVLSAPGIEGVKEKSTQGKKEG